MKAISYKVKLIVIVYIVITIVFAVWYASELNPALKNQITEAEKQHMDARSQELLFIGDEAYPPFSYVGNRGYSGYEADLLYYLKQILDIEVRYQQMNWTEALSLLEAGESVVITGMKITDDRQERFLYTNPYLITTQALVYRHDLGEISLEDLQDLEVIVQENSVTHTLAKSWNAGVIHTVKDPIEGLELLVNGVGDVWIENQMTALYFLRLHTQDQYYSVSAIEESTGYYAMALPKGQKNTRDILNKALYQLEQNGTIAVLDNKWFGIVGYRTYSEKSFWYYAAVVGHILLTATFIFYLWNKSLHHQLAKRTDDLKETNKLLDQERKNIQSLLEGITRAFSATIDYRDYYTGDHSRRVTSISVLIANELGLSEEEIFETYIGALLHDIGKVGIPDHILNKAGALTDEEYYEIKQHPVIGANILAEIQSYKTIKAAVLYHHERWDGNIMPPYAAYPGLLKGEEIPLVARIIAVADAFDAMTTDRPYRKAMSVEVATNRIKAESGKQFDPKVVECFMRILSYIDINDILNSYKSITKQD
ncbi:HD domain-containing phosphohydrolase [Desulfuribacillus alkaliarsenatis]|uniref:Uncharacterized protein n=1 Tax=Desulfuribacillus alkaliarsenatis TaxID=766136 RepID=A0A1E5G125_9FIRM|nr:transporter substrate-binding domain-containing protein [Desulfuribacillus alkaliarsenatis]OEF96612.1 hypothetical protein BHF68_08190 [Desulfuribacillus alkaliarsenatis]